MKNGRSRPPPSPIVQPPSHRAQQIRGRHGAVSLVDQRQRAVVVIGIKTLVKAVLRAEVRPRDESAGGVPRPRQLLGQGFDAGTQTLPVFVDLMLVLRHARQHRHVRREGPRRRSDGLGKPNPLRRQGIDRRAGFPPIARTRSDDRRAGNQSKSTGYSGALPRRGRPRGEPPRHRSQTRSGRDQRAQRKARNRSSPDEARYDDAGDSPGKQDPESEQDRQSDRGP